MASSWLENYKVATGSTIKPLRNRLAAPTTEDDKTSGGSCTTKKQKTSQKTKQKRESDSEECIVHSTIILLMFCTTMIIMIFTDLEYKSELLYAIACSTCTSLRTFRQWSIFYDLTIFKQGTFPATISPNRLEK